MVKAGKWIAKHKVLVLFDSDFRWVIPSVIGIAETRVNYDLLSYLPETLETGKRAGYAGGSSLVWAPFPW